MHVDLLSSWHIVPMWVEEEEDLTQTTSYPIYTIHTSLDDSTIDEDTFLENFCKINIQMM
jgi:hypothetical protein